MRSRSSLLRDGLSKFRSDIDVLEVSDFDMRKPLVPSDELLEFCVMDVEAGLLSDFSCFSFPTASSKDSLPQRISLFDSLPVEYFSLKSLVQFLRQHAVCRFHSPGILSGCSIVPKEVVVKTFSHWNFAKLYAENLLSFVHSENICNLSPAETDHLKELIALHENLSFDFRRAAFLALWCRLNDLTLASPPDVAGGGGKLSFTELICAIRSFDANNFALLKRYLQSRFNPVGNGAESLEDPAGILHWTFWGLGGWAEFIAKKISITTPVLLPPPLNEDQPEGHLLLEIRAFNRDTLRVQEGAVTFIL
ncbi:hypothetical protein CBR_g38169 [Chara braunii]|uniref:Uncharacterized protein n=1 Tax=Chara braunii TaxID=69332 RepID=A0A388LPE1_CHABU|nr:hypothetical protein CBR_g38169 [Chara braunii]|eukprot:GBG84198.1 hypothetical protein CBR_g38169 [Chara braunii]